MVPAAHRPGGGGLTGDGDEGVQAVDPVVLEDRRHRRAQPRRDVSGWRDAALCKGRPLSLWFPGPYDELAAHVAVAVCQQCPVRAECLRAALAEEAELSKAEMSGIRGGLLPSQRLTLAERGSVYRQRRSR